MKLFTVLSSLLLFGLVYGEPPIGQQQIVLGVPKTGYTPRYTPRFTRRLLSNKFAAAPAVQPVVDVQEVYKQDNEPITLYNLFTKQYVNNMRNTDVVNILSKIIKIITTAIRPHFLQILRLVISLVVTLFYKWFGK